VQLIDFIIRNYHDARSPERQIHKIYIYIYILGPRRDEVTGEWRRLHNEELNDLYSSPNIVRVIEENIWT